MLFRILCCGTLAGGLAFGVAGCSQHPQALVSCPEGEIATVSGCRPLPPRPISPALDAGIALDAAIGKPIPGEDVDAAMEADSIADAGSTAMDASAEVPGAFDLTGDWALRTVVLETITTDNQRTASGTTVTVASVRLSGSGSSATASTRICDVDVAPEGDYRIRYPRSAIAAFPVVESALRVDSLALGTAVHADPRPMILGWTPLQDGMQDTFPTGPTDARIVNTDGDRGPGVSLEMRQTTGLGQIEGDLYVVSRTVTTLEGTLTAEGRIEGQVTATREELRLGVSNNRLPVRQLSVMQNPDATQSTFALVRLPPGTTADCATINDMSAQLFP